MLAYHNKPELKAEYVSRMQAHIEADELIRGDGWDGSRGCAVGCTFNKYDHGQFEPVLGIPEWAGWLIDALHEGVSTDYLNKGRPVALAFLEAIRPGADLSRVEHEMHLFIQRRNLERVRGLDISAELKSQVEKAIEGVMDVRQKALDFGWDESAAESAKSAAESAARSARSAARSARSAARSAAESAARSAVESAWSAARSARSAAYDAIADEFIRLLEAV